MDDELQQLEDELRRLRPSRVSDRLSRALERSLATSGRRRAARIIVLAGVALPVAAAIALIFVWTPRENARDERGSVADDGAPDVARFKPVAADSVLLDERDEGYVVFADGMPARRWRQFSVDRITWKDAATNASLTWTVPREEVRVVPVSFQ